MAEKENIKKRISLYINSISKKYPIKQVILFGSYARGNPNKDSDIDLAVISPKFTDKNHLDDLKFLWVEAAKIDSRIEPLPFSSKDMKEVDSRSFLGEILRCGRTVYKK